MQPTDLRRLLRRGEQPKVDFKSELVTKSREQKAAFIQDAIALTNAPGGNGYMVVGIDDATREPIAGYRCDSVEALDRLIAQYVEPMIRMTEQRVELDGVPVTVVTFVRDAQLLPHWVKRGIERLEANDWWVRHGRHNARPTVEDQRAIFEEARRARRTRPASVRNDEPDEYAALSVQERLRRMHEDVLSAVRAPSLRRSVPRLRLATSGPTGDFLAALGLWEQGVPLAAQVQGVDVLLLIHTREGPIVGTIRHGARHDIARRRLRVGRRGSMAVPVSLVLSYGGVREAALKRELAAGTRIRTPGSTVFRMPCGYYVGPSLPSLAAPPVLPPPEDEITPQASGTSGALGWADRMAMGELAYAPEIFVGEVRSTAAILRGIGCALAWIEALPLAEMRDRMLAFEPLREAKRRRRSELWRRSGR